MVIKSEETFYRNPESESAIEYILDLDSLSNPQNLPQVTYLNTPSFSPCHDSSTLNQILDSSSIELQSSQNSDLLLRDARPVFPKCVARSSGSLGGMSSLAHKEVAPDGEARSRIKSRIVDGQVNA